jgi:GTP diphosphokinase / guanosine-3',5'-bis(diphosphate) 3'-diphosphatase
LISMKTLDTDALIHDIITQYEKYGKGGSDTIQKAYEYAKKCHANHTRKSGEPYINHPVSATNELMVIQPDVTTIVATLLHDVVSDGSGDLAEIGKLF